MPFGSHYFFILLCVIILCLYLNDKIKSNTSYNQSGKIDFEYFSRLYKLIDTRDFIRYNCKDRKRIGGELNYTSKTTESLMRIDGAWFLCFDKQVAPVKHGCKVLSFGINTDESFDYEMNQKYCCYVYSFVTP